MSAIRRPSHLAAVGLALLVTVLWSSSWILIRWGLADEGLPPLTFAALRYGLASLFVVGWMLRRERQAADFRNFDGQTLAILIALGVVMYSITQGAQFVAIANQPVATTSLVLSLSPLLAVGVAAVSLSEVPSSRQLAGAVLVALGAWLFFEGDLGATTAGMVAAIVGLCANVGAAILGRRVNREARLSPVVVTGYSMAIGSVVLVVVGLAAEGVPVVSPRAWLIILWLAIVNTAVAFTLWNLSLRRLSAVESVGINNTMLIQIALLAWAFLGESLGPAEIVGVGLVSAGVFLTQRFTGVSRTRNGAVARRRYS